MAMHGRLCHRERAVRTKTGCCSSSTSAGGIRGGEGGWVGGCCSCGECAVTMWKGAGAFTGTPRLASLYLKGLSTPQRGREPSGSLVWPGLPAAPPPGPWGRKQQLHAHAAVTLDRCCPEVKIRPPVCTVAHTAAPNARVTPNAPSLGLLGRQAAVEPAVRVLREVSPRGRSGRMPPVERSGVAQESS